MKIPINKILHILRNPYGYHEEEIKQARLQAADEIERWKNAFENLQAWCDKNGWDTTTRR